MWAFMNVRHVRHEVLPAVFIKIHVFWDITIVITGTLFYVKPGRNAYVNEKFLWHHRESNLRPSGLLRSASANCANAWRLRRTYTRVNKNPSAWNFLSPKPEVTCSTRAIIIRVVLLSPYLRIRAVSLSSIHYNQSHRVYINRRRQYICLIWN